jgi:hypothetical protein
VPVQGCTLPYSRAIPLLPLWAVQPVQSLSACTRVHFTLQQSYTSTHPMGGTACTEPQCLHKGARYLNTLYKLHVEKWESYMISIMVKDKILFQCVFLCGGNVFS